ncbi:LssY C-terminal domain-containing protein [Vibrio sp. Sgm 5]|uniref:LssY C-terminal domain-containing protein n=1 Tax=Vibrio sp. Sgm 5 TaxID=2994387 RepID=UPI002249A280|nr:LssY C-terminal domain-containing protein [Vibrio sp. Sgm 5]MCX2789827.1 LssY C-terminal domain-containing protein [Vibrio sp. Sgm 5]
MLEAISLFFGAFLDATIGPNLFVPGEPFLLAAGYQLHQGIIWGVIAVLMGGWLGDQLSYFIGKRSGSKAQRKLIRWQAKTKRPIARCRLLMKKCGNAILIFARLLGPVAWVVPFMAGSVNVSWKRFTVCSSIGLMLGVGQFVIAGYLLAAGLQTWLPLDSLKLILIEHKLLIASVLVAVTFTVVAWKKNWSRKWTKSLTALVLCLVAANYGHFFYLADDNVEQVESTEIRPIAFNELGFKVYPGRSNVFDAQAVNLVYVGESPRTLMQELGWLENQTFSRNDIELSNYVSLLKQKLPPVSDLFWNGKPQAMAFQEPGSLLKRSHIRWWQAGHEASSNQSVWVGAISYDDGLKLAHYSGIVTVLHRIDPNVDSERDRLANQIEMSHLALAGELYSLAQPVAMDNQHDYYSDGNVLLISEPSLALNVPNQQSDTKMAPNDETSISAISELSPDVI